MQTDIAESIYQAALSCGFDHCGIISLDDLDGFDSFLQERKKSPPAEYSISLQGDWKKPKSGFPGQNR